MMAVVATVMCVVKKQKAEKKAENVNSEVQKKKLVISLIDKGLHSKIWAVVTRDAPYKQSSWQKLPANTHGSSRPAHKQSTAVAACSFLIINRRRLFEINDILSLEILNHVDNTPRVCFLPPPSSSFLLHIYCLSHQARMSQPRRRMAPDFRLS